MFLKEIAIEALQKAGLIHGEHAPADRYNLAIKAVAGALKHFSECDTIACFSAHRKVTLANETTIGLPPVRRGIRLHFAAGYDNLPSLAGYNPNDGSYVIDRDFYLLDDDSKFYGIALVGTSYTWVPVEQSIVATDDVDIPMKDFGNVTALYGNDGRLKPTKLSSFFALGGGYFVCNIDGEGRRKIYVKEPGEYDMVYTRSLAFNENTKVDVTATQHDLVVTYAASQLARNSDKKASLERELSICLSDASDNAGDDAIPTRSEW